MRQASCQESTLLVFVLGYVALSHYTGLPKPLYTTPEEYSDRGRALAWRLFVDATVVVGIGRIGFAVPMALLAVLAVLAGVMARWARLGGRHADLVWDTALFTFIAACGHLVCWL